MTTVAFPDDLKDLILKASLEKSLEVDKTAKFTFICVRMSRNNVPIDVFVYEGPHINAARAKIKAASKDGINSLVNPVLAYAPCTLPIVLCCLFPKMICCTGRLYIKGVVPFEYDGIQYMYCGAGSIDCEKDVISAKAGLEAAGFVPNEKGVYIKIANIVC